MKPGNFDYIRAVSVEEAVAALAAHGEGARLLAGGQSLIPMMNFRLVTPSVLIDIGRLGDLNTITIDGDTLVIGAGARHNAVLASEVVRNACPLLTDAYAHVAHHGVRNRGTIGGNVCQHDPASEVPLILVLLGARLTLVGPNGSRTVASADFFVDQMETTAASDEILTQVRVPRQDAGVGWAFDEVSPRKGDYAIVGAGCLVSVDDGTFGTARVGFIGAGAHIKRMPGVEAMLEGHPATDATIEVASERAVELAEPSDDVQADAEYKRDLIRTLGARVMRRAMARAA